ncbi:Uncharacterized protein DAT39_019173, partial [Clarias magur]
MKKLIKQSSSLLDSSNMRSHGKPSHQQLGQVGYKSKEAESKEVKKKISTASPTSS